MMMVMVMDDDDEAVRKRERRCKQANANCEVPDCRCARVKSIEKAKGKECKEMEERKDGRMRKMNGEVRSEEREEVVGTTDESAGMGREEEG